MIYTATITVLLFASTWARPTPAVSNSTGTLTFLVVGDWGGQNTSPYYTAAQKDVAAAMGKTAQTLGSQFTVSVGDNFYDVGATDVNDPRFKETFEDIFTSPSLQTRWYQLCGNHDHAGNASAQIAYTQLSKRWYMPDFYYTETISIPGSTATVQFIIIDTIILCDDVHPTKKGSPSSSQSYHTAADEWAWINSMLQSSTADWIFVFGHYPVWSVGSNGPTKQLVDQLRPLLLKYGVDGYFSGHDHSLQFINDTDISYIVSGAGHETSHSKAHVDDVPPNSLQFHYGPHDKSAEHGGYVSVSLTPSIMTVTYYDESGSMLFSTEVPNNPKD